MGSIVKNRLIQEKMKSITLFLNNLKNSLPYLLLILLYFFFVNLEANKEKNTNLTSERDNILSDGKTSLKEENLRLSIPVIPYK